jgi:hypothetical protein
MVNLKIATNNKKKIKFNVKTKIQFILNHKLLNNITIKIPIWLKSMKKLRWKLMSM